MNIIRQLATDIGAAQSVVEKIINLIDEGNTIPFIARYRKEATGDIGDEKLRLFETRLKYLRNLEERKAEIISSIQEQGKMTPELLSQIQAASMLQTLEDLYRPYKIKKATRASKARDMGLEPLANKIFDQQPFALEDFAKELELAEDIPLDERIAGAMDIVAEDISNMPDLRARLRENFYNTGQLESSLSQPQEDLSESELGGRAKHYEIYSDYRQLAADIPGHRILALNRGDKMGDLSVKLRINKESASKIIEKTIIKNPQFEHISLLKDAAADSLDRLIFPSIEREIRSLLTKRAETEAIEVFGTNTKSLLMQAPIQPSVVLALDPAYRTGCKIAVLDENGKLTEYTTIYPHKPQAKWDEAKEVLKSLIRKYGVAIIAIGNGTASRESEKLAAEIIEEMPAGGSKDLGYIIVNEAGASVYSASKLASEEYPGIDVSIRGAISIGRRLQDPLSEYVKIDPKSIGVGQYQHDVNQKQLAEKLDSVVEDVVNAVGVDLNIATAPLLSYISGISAPVAKNIVKQREREGVFTSRAQLMTVPRLGPKTFQQAAGFLRIRSGDEPLDNTAVHPESYGPTYQLFEILGVSPADLVGNAEKVEGLVSQHSESGSYEDGLQNLAELLEVGMPTLRDILEELKKPGRDPRSDLPKPVLRQDVLSFEDLHDGMQLRGTVRNLVDFGAFIDIGVKQDGLVHISEISNSFVKHPTDVLKIGDVVNVVVIGTDMDRRKISLSMKRLQKKTKEG